MTIQIWKTAREMLVGACLAGGCLADVVANAADGAKEIETERIVIKDKNGKVRMVLGMNAQGDPEITIHGSDGKDRMRLGLKDGTSPSVTLSDPAGTTRVQLSVADEGAASATIADSNGKSRIGMVVGKDGAPIVKLNGADGKERVGLHVNSRSNAIVRVRDAAEKIRSAMFAYPDGTSYVNLLDESGRVRVGLNVNTAGAGSLRLNDDQNKARVVVAHNANVTDLALYDSRGKLRQLTSVDGNGVPQQQFRDREGNVRLMFDMGPEGDPQMTMYRKDGKALTSMASRGMYAGQTYFGADGNARINFGVSNDGIPGLLFYDGQARGARMTLRVLPRNNGTPIISLMDKKGTDRMGLVMTDSDDPMFGLRDGGGVDRAVVGIHNDLPIMVLNGRGGNEQAAFAVAPDESAFLRLHNANGQRTLTAAP